MGPHPRRGEGRLIEAKGVQSLMYRRSALISLGAAIVVAVGAYWAGDMLLLGLGGAGSGIPPQPATAAELGVEIPESVAASLRVEAVEEREFPIENNAVGSIDFNEDMTLQVFASY